MSDVEDGTVAAAAGGADQLKPAAKKQRKLTEADLGGPIEDEETARQKLKDAGFDPENIKGRALVVCPDGDGPWYVNPICHFAGAGDLKMCRYLVTHGASTTDAVTRGDGDVIWFPIVVAARNGMTKAVEWLYHHGARGDIHKTDDVGDSPLQSSLSTWDTPGGDTNTAQWLILHGAIPSDKDGNLDKRVVAGAFFLHPSVRRPKPWNERERLLQWAESACASHDGFYTFLQGTMLRASESSRRAPPIRCLSGYVGIRKNIAGYVGVMTGRNLRTVRGIIGPLKKVLKKRPASV